MSSTSSDIRVLVDFDGTIVPGDVTDHIFESFAGSEWLDLEKEWQAGRMNSRACMAAQVDLIRASRADIVRAVAERDIDPAFPEFVRECRSRDMSITIVSDGFDLAIQAVLERYSLDLPYFANHLAWRGDDRWRLEFPHRNTACPTEAGNCKCRQIASGRTRTVVIGDGRSDFCAAANADFVLAKSSLTRHCQTTGIRHWAITDFSEILAHFDAWIKEARTTKRSQQPTPRVAQHYPAVNQSPTTKTQTALTG